MDGNFRIGQWLVQPQLNLIQGPGGDTPVEPKAMEVLVCLAKQAGEVVPKERLMQTVWADTFVTDEVLTNSIWELLKAFGDEAKKPKVIQTVFNKGYRLIAPVYLENRTSEPVDSQVKPGSKQSTRKAALLLRWWIGAGVTLAVFAGVAFSLRSRQPGPVSAPPPRPVPLTR
ncbi:MAG TPA: winged helix-turn-helix domain-containing protein [Terriglobia bacterium]|nr:winged helix-turn-helix domain-containing protein [Terriglobia bacterium]